jgi:DNA-binding NarL/FixJ family response regulator
LPAGCSNAATKAKSGSAISDLTTRESDILRLIAGGLANEQIGTKLQLSEKTMK